MRGVRLIDPLSGTDAQADVSVFQGKVAPISPPSSAPSGLWLIPGIVDVHVHLRVPGGEGAETLLTGLRAAVAGGVTALGMMPNTIPPLDSPRETMEIVRRGNSLGLARIHPVPCVTMGRKGFDCVNFEGFLELGIKAFSDDGSPVGSDSSLREAFRRLAPAGGTVIEHPEVTAMAAGGAVNLGEASRVTGAVGIPEAAEFQDVQRCMDILAGAPPGARLHLTHLSSPESIRRVRRAVEAGLSVTCDTTPHHLALNENSLITLGTVAKMNPPLRSEASRREVVELAGGGFVDAVASDHAPHPTGSKKGSIQDAAFGITGLETLLPVTVDTLVNRAGMEPMDVIRMLTVSPASILGIDPPGISPGRTANMVLFDPEGVWTYNRTFSKSSNSPFIGGELRGRILSVWIGKEIYSEGRFV